MTPARRREIAEETRAVLVAVFPDCFAGKGQQKRPLKIGVYRDLKAHFPEISGTRLKIALADYTSGRTYLQNMVEGAERIGLDGKPAGRVTGTEAAHAATRLEARERSWRKRQRNIRRAA